MRDFRRNSLRSVYTSKLHTMQLYFHLIGVHYAIEHVEGLHARNQTQIVRFKLQKKKLKPHNKTYANTN